MQQRTSRSLAAPHAESAPRSYIPDPLDYQIISALAEDPLTTNKAMALRFAVTEPTIGTRIRNLSDRGIMRVSIQRDLRAHGFPVFAFLDIYAGGRPPGEIAEKLAAIEDVTGVVTSLGGPEIMVNMCAKTQLDLCRTIEEKIAPISGIRRYELHICIENIKQISGYGNLSPGVQSWPHPALSDETDEAIASLLYKDGRRSNRDIARHLGLSEGSIRQRLKRLTEDRTISRGVICDPAMIGKTVVVLARMSTAPADMPALRTALKIAPSCFFAADTIGRFNHIALFLAESYDEVDIELNNVTAKVTAALDIDAKILVRAYKHRYDLVTLN